MYKNIIFDLGNVLMNFKPKEYLESKIMEIDKIPMVYREMFESQEWIMLDRGSITEEEAKKAIFKRAGENGYLIELAFENWYEILTPIYGTVEILKELKSRGYRVYYLSNFHLLAFEHIIRKYDFFNLFDGGVLSYKENLLKPEEYIYKRIIEKYSMIPGETIFVDDTKVNISGAEKLGFKTILFKNPAILREDLKKLHVNIE